MTLEDPDRRDRETKVAGLIKGETACNRRACQCRLTIGQRWWNTFALAFYCHGCAHRINQLSGTLEKPCVLEALEKS